MLRLEKISHQQMSESFLLGSLLAVSGGFLDAYTYLSRGKVFANAQTGNMVLLGLHIAEGNIIKVIYYLIPIIAFIVGIILVEWIQSRYKNNNNITIHWRQIIIIIEVVILFFVAFIPSDQWNIIANTAVSFVCSMQVESFRKVKGNAFATTMCTGNLRSATEQLYRYKHTKDKEAWNKSLQYYGIILFFIVGAVVGVFFTKYFGEKSIFICCIDLLIVFFIMFIEKKE